MNKLNKISKSLYFNQINIIINVFNINTINEDFLLTGLLNIYFHGFNNIFLLGFNED